MGRVTCAVSGCSSSKNGPSSLSFYRINSTYREIDAWIKFCCNPFLSKHSVVCSLHFQESDFSNPRNKSQGLYLHARPSLFPGVPEGTSDAMTVQPRTTDEVMPMETEINYYAADDMAIAGELEVVPMYNSEPRIPEPTESVHLGIGLDAPVKHDHDYVWDFERITMCMERLVLVEEENRNLKKKMRVKQKRMATLKARVRDLTKERDELKAALKSQSPELMDPMLLELQRNKSRKQRGARYSAKMRNMAIILHYCSSKAYRQMRQFFTLPSVGTINRWLSKLEIKEGYSATVLKLLKFKVAGLPEDEKLVTVFIDEMSVSQRLTYVANSEPDYFMGFPTKVESEPTNLNQRASTALTIMVKSIKSGFKQAIGYFFNPSSLNTDRLRSIVEKGLKLITEAGLIPKLLVCDQNSTNRSLFRHYGVSAERPWFIFQKKKICCAFDAPHLAKSARNNLLKHNAVLDGKICSFEHIIALFNEDVKCFPRLVPKLTAKHVDLAPYAEMNVSLATQTLSSSVSAGLKAYVGFKKLPQMCLNTAAYTECFDKLFDCANSSTFNVTKDLKKPLQKNSAHWEFLRSMKTKLKLLRFIPKGCFDLKKEGQFAKLPSHSRRPYFVDGWLIYISAIEALWEDLHTNHGFSFLRTRNLSQDCLEHFFSLIRWKNCNNNHPDPSKFASAFKSIVINQIMAPKKLGNVEADLDKYFVSTLEMSKVKFISNPVAKKKTTKNTDPKMEINQSNSVYYTSGWVASKLIHEDCIKRAYGDTRFVSRENQILLNLKKFKPDSKLNPPGLGIFRFCKKLVAVFETNFEVFLKKSVKGVKQKLLDLIFWPYKSQNEPEQLIYNTLCVSCAKSIANKYFNMLIKAKLQNLNMKIQTSEQKKRKDNKSKKVLTKRKKLNIIN